MFSLATYLLWGLNNVMDLKVMTMAVTSAMAGNWRWLDSLLSLEAGSLLKQYTMSHKMTAHLSWNLNEPEYGLEPQWDTLWRSQNIREFTQQSLKRELSRRCLVCTHGLFVPHLTSPSNNMWDLIPQAGLVRCKIWGGVGVERGSQGLTSW